MLVSINGTQAKLWTNCNTLEKRPLAGPIDLKMPKGVVIHFSQEPASKNKLLVNIGTVSDVLSPSDILGNGMVNYICTSKDLLFTITHLKVLLNLIHSKMFFAKFNNIFG